MDFVLPRRPAFSFDTLETPTAPVAPVCGYCREWLEREPGLRGTCLHPGSGIMHPWPDTPGCPFFRARR